MKKVLSINEILEKGKPLPDKEVFLKSLDGHVVLKNITFRQMVEIQKERDQDGYPIALVAACLGMSFEDAQELQANAYVFADIFNAVNAHLNAPTDDNLKN